MLCFFLVEKGKCFQKRIFPILRLKEKESDNHKIEKDVRSIDHNRIETM
jgi:hypothetical protein